MDGWTGLACLFLTLIQSAHNEHRALKTNANVSTHMYQVINSTWYQAIYAELTGSLKGTKAAKTQPVYDIFVLLIPL